MKTKYFLIGSVILNLILIFMLLVQQYQIDEQLKAWPVYDNRELLECKQMNANATRLLKNETIVVRLK